MQWFPRKKAALDNAKGAVVACEEGDSWRYGSGLDWCGTAAEFCKLRPNERRWHECINPEVPVRLFFDIDGNDLTKEQMATAIQTIQSLVRTAIDDHVQWVILDGSRKNKQSVHILTDVYFASIHSVRGFVEKELIPKLPSPMQRYFDTQVYRGGNFRTAFSHKLGVPMLPTGAPPLTPELWVSLLLTAMPTGAKRFAYHVPEPKQPSIKSHGGAGWSAEEINQIITIIEETVIELYGTQTEFHTDIRTTGMTVTVPVANIPCERKHGVHESNRIMLQVQLPLPPSLRKPLFYYFDLGVRAKFHCMDTGDCGKWADWSNPTLDARLTQRIEESFPAVDALPR